VTILTPGERPLDQLARAVSSTLTSVKRDTLSEDLRSDVESLGLAIAQGIVDERAGTRLMLCVDQLEELFTLHARETESKNEVERELFLGALLATAKRSESRATVILALRSDFYGRLAAYPTVPEALRGNDVLVGPLREDELRRAIVQPAVHVGLNLEPGLVDHVVSDLGHEHGALPLLSHALLETCRYRRGRTLTISGYLKAGGVRGAIGKTADAALASLNPAEKALARTIFLRLTSVGDGTEDTRKRATLADLVPMSEKPASVRDVIEVLVDARLLTASEDGYEVAHEALIRNWKTLRGWLDEDRDNLRILNRLSDESKRWRDGRATLYRGAELLAVNDWAASHDLLLNELEREFLDASRAAERRRTRRLLALSVTLAVLLAAALGSAALAIRQSNEASQQQRNAENEADIATSRRLAAEALGTLGVDADLARLLSLEAYLLAPTAEARNSLLESVQESPRLQATLRGHQGREGASDVALSPDGKTLASAGFDGTVRLWDVADARALGEPVRAGGAVSRVAFSPDGRMLAAAGARGVKVWAVERRHLASPLSPYGDSVLDLVFTADGERLAWGDSKGRITFWDLEQRRPIWAPLETDVAFLSAIAIRPDGRVLASAGFDSGRVQFWDVARQRPLGPSLPTGLPVIFDLEFSPDGTTLATAGPRAIMLWDLESGSSPSRLSVGGQNANGIAFSSDGRVLAAAASDGAVTLWDVEAGQQLGSPLRAHGGAALSVDFARDGATVASAGTDGTLRLWEAKRQVPFGAVSVLDQRTESVALSDDGAIFAAGGADGSVRLWEGTTGRPLHSPRQNNGRAITDLVFSAKGSRLAMADVDGRVRLWDVVNGRPLDAPVLPGGVETAIALSPAGTILASSRDGEVRLWDVAKHRRLATLGATDDPLVYSLVFSPDGTMLASGAAGGRLALWDVVRSRSEALDGGGGAELVELAFAKDGKLLASAGADGEIRLWDAVRHRRLARSIAGRNKASAVVFSADGRTLAFAGEDEIRVWDVLRGRMLGRPLGDQDAAIETLAFTVNGSLVSGARNGSIVMWDAFLFGEDPGVWHQRICRMVGRSMTSGEWRNYLPGEPYRPTCREASRQV
jgi:WD40 repeat protein